jgi:spermidine/putrescine transport system permease protein
MNRLLKGSYLAAIYLFFYFPIAVLIVYSFNRSAYSLVWQGFSMTWYHQLFSDSALFEVAWHSLAVAILAASAATIIGTMASVTLYRYRFLGRKLLHALIFVLIVSPDIVMGISLLILFATIHTSLGFLTLLLSHITFCIPFVVVTVYSRLTGIDKNIFEAAKDLGANDFIIFIRIILPLIMPAVIAGWLLSFTLSMDDVIISFFVTGPNFEILPLKIYSLVRLGVKPEINALCSVMFGLTLLFVTVAQMLQKRNTIQH